MKNLSFQIVSIFLFFAIQLVGISYPLTVNAQEKASLNSINEKVKGAARSVKNKSNITTQHIDGLKRIMQTYTKFEKEEKNSIELSGGGLGNITNLRDRFDLTTTTKANWGIYPVEVDFLLDFFGQVSQSKLTQNVSRFDISVDYHPFEISKNRIKKARKLYEKRMTSLKGAKNSNNVNEKPINKIKNKEYWNSGLPIEVYGLFRREDNSFLGTNARYEFGGGIIFNLYSHKKLTKKGAKQQDLLDKLPYIDYKENFKKTSLSTLVIQYLSNTKTITGKHIIIEVKNDFTEILKVDAKEVENYFNFLQEYVINMDDNSKKPTSLFNLDDPNLNQLFLSIPSTERQNLIRFEKKITKELEKKLFEKISEYTPIDLNSNILECYLNICKRPKLQLEDDYLLTEEEIILLQENGYKFRNLNIKKYAKWRLALLVGLYYELDDTNLFSDNVTTRENNNGLFPTIGLQNSDFPINIQEDSTFEIRNFGFTRKWRWQVRPTLMWQPTDKIQFAFRPYIKFPLENIFNSQNYEETEVPVLDANGKRIFLNLEESLTENPSLPDIFLDVQTSLQFKITPNLSFSFNYIYMRDIAPKRIKFKEPEINLTGQKLYQQFRVNISYKL